MDTSHFRHEGSGRGKVQRKPGGIYFERNGTDVEVSNKKSKLIPFPLLRTTLTLSQNRLPVMVKVHKRLKPSHARAPL